MVINELILVLGLVICVLTVPAILHAIKEGIPPRGAAVAILLGGSMVSYAVYTTPGGFAFNELPDIVMRLFRSITNYV